jgi:uncharacterized SAM-binding protein YcdF (DUF218 family)
MYLLWTKSFVRELLLPPGGLLLLAFLGLLLLSRHARLGRALLLIALLSLWLLATPVFAHVLRRLAEHYPALDLNQLGGAQAIVILGGGGQRALAPEYGEPAANAVLLERLAYGAYVARRTGLPILVSGNGIEAIAMRQTLRRNFDLEPRWLDAQSYDTFENARDSVALLKHEGIERIVLVTSATHMWRAVHEFIAAGVAVLPAPEGMIESRHSGVLQYVPSADGLTQSYEASYELVGEPVRMLLAASHLRRQ